MKEERYFYSPNPTDGILTAEESNHATKVLRLKEGDDIQIIDGKGNLHQCIITLVKKQECHYEIRQTNHFESPWNKYLDIVVAPTKNMDRTEWFAEKATEIGVDQIDFVNCRFSERKVIKTERIEKIVVSAMKQSHKFYKPIINDIKSFKDIVTTPFDGIRCIAHCYEDSQLLINDSYKPFLLDAIASSDSAIQVLIGPEGDFSADEVKLALKNGFIPISLGESRLRTETAALVAVHLMQLSARNNTQLSNSNKKNNI